MIAFWIGVFVLAVGVCLYGLTFVLPGPKFQRLVNKSSKRSVRYLKDEISSGRAKQYGEGYADLFQRSIELHQGQHVRSPYQIRPVPLVRPSIALMLIGIALTIAGSLR